MKPVAAFVVGVVVASGIAYMALGGKQEQKPATPQQATSTVQQPVAAPASTPPPVAEPTPAPVREAVTPVREVEPKHARYSSVGRRPAHKISPAASPAPVKQPDPAPQQVAQNTAPAPVSQPVVNPTPVVREEPRAPEPPPKPEPRSVTINPGTTLSVRLEESLSTDRSYPGDKFRASLAAPLTVNGLVIAERGARVQGRVAEIDKGGKMQGVSHLALELTSLTTSDGQNVALRTERFRKQAETTHGRDAAKIGGGAALGAIIGAIAGGGKGAAIGAGVGGAAGAGDVALTRGKAAEIPVETKLTFRIADPVTVTERVRD
jgi:hypothetical protein